MSPALTIGSYVPRSYDELVRDLLTTLTGGTATETHPVPAGGLSSLIFDRKPFRRLSFLQGSVMVGEDPIGYRFTERDLELIPSEGSTPASPSYDGVRFGNGQIPAPNTLLTVNYYPVRMSPTPLNDANVGSVVRTLLETVARELATQNQQLGLVYDSAFVGTALGTSLDNVASLVDVRRIKKRHPVGRVRFSRRSGSPGNVSIPVETAVTDGEGNRYLTTDPATMLNEQSFIEVWVHGESAGTEPVDGGKLFILERAIAGVDRVTNEQPTFRAAEDETDDQLRGRARVAIHGTGRGTLHAIRSGLEALPFVSAVNLTERPDDVAGTLRVDLALTEDTAFNRSVVDRRILELRPAGIGVSTSYAGRLDLRMEAGLTLAGSFQPTTVIDEICNGVRSRIEDEVKNLAPGATLRRARLLSATLGDARIVDASLVLVVAGIPVTGDTFTVPATEAVQLNGQRDVSFLPVQFEAPGAGGPASIPVDLKLVVSLLDSAANLDSVRGRVQTVVSPLLAAAKTLTAEAVQSALATEPSFVALAVETVVSVEVLPGQFTDLASGDPAFQVPQGSNLQLRDVNLTEAG